MMKKGAFLLILFICIASASAITQDYSSRLTAGNTRINVVTVKYEPFPVSPGTYFDLWLKIENTGDQGANDVSFKLTLEYPFSIDANEVAERNFGSLGSHSSAILHYKVKVDQNAVEGDFPLKYEARVDGAREQSSFNIRIQTVDAVLAIKDTTTDPATIPPGGKSTITITLQNQADTSLRYITASLDLFRQVTTTSGISTFELPFTPFGGGRERSFFQIDPGEEKELVFEVVANPDAESKPYKIPIDITYTDLLGKNYSKKEIVGVIVNSPPKIDIIVEDTELSRSNKIGSITLKIINRGATDVKFAIIELTEAEDFNVISSPTDYVGEIDSDDFQNADFRIKAKRNDFTIPVVISYSDANNNEYVEERDVEIELRSEKELGTSDGKGGTVLIIIIILMVLAYYFYRRWEIKIKKKR